MTKTDKIAVTGLGAFFIIFCIIAVIKDGTGHSGDSIEHFLISKFAFKHPEHFFHHWGKPVFVLLSAPFAQFGFIGMKIFNVCLAILTGYFGYLTGKKLNLNYPYLSVLFLFMAPLYFVLIFSGLTEYLMGFAIILAIYLILDNKYIPAIIIISFTPFMRSEGLVIIGVFAFYLLIKRKFKLLPLLITGHLIYSIAGYFIYKDLLWVFNKIPYLNIGSPYGSGHLLDFAGKLYYVIGFPLMILLGLGFVYILRTFFKPSIYKNRKVYAEDLILIYGSFSAFFAAHSLFWWLGIFNSMGLGRVLNSVVPLAVLIGLHGLNMVASSKNKLVNKSVVVLFGVFVVFFFFWGNPASVNWKKDLNLSEDQLLVNAHVPIIAKEYSTATFYYSRPYVGLVLGIDHFDQNRHKFLRDLSVDGGRPENLIIIWDHWFSAVEEGKELGTLLSDPDLLLLSEHQSLKDPSVKIAIFKSKPE